MDKAEVLYKYVDKCFSIDIMTSIFLENYEYNNEATTYADIIRRYSETLVTRWAAGVSSKQLSEALEVLEERFKNEAIRIISKEFMKYYTNKINQHYLYTKKANLSVNELKSNYILDSQHCIDLLERFQGELRDSWKRCDKPTEFYLAAIKKLRIYEEQIYEFLKWRK